MTASRMYRVQNGTLLPLDLQAVSPTMVPAQNAPQRPTDDAEARQTQYEYEKAYRALHQAEERLEMLGCPDMAREVRMVRSRLALGR